MNFLKFLRFQRIIFSNHLRLPRNRVIFYGLSTVSGILFLNNQKLNNYIDTSKWIKASCLSKNFVADLVEVVSPAVVTINKQGFILGSVGSGFIVDKSGLVISNSHVVGKANIVDVVMSNGQRFVGKVLAIDPITDLALIKFEPGGLELTLLELETEKLVRPGEFVAALGSPLSFSNSVTFGIISAIDRDLGTNGGTKYIQTDALVTVGNSGGPLVNLDGKVIGVNTMMAVAGIGFAIPSKNVQNFIRIARDRIHPSKLSSSPSSVSRHSSRPSLSPPVLQKYTNPNTPNTKFVGVTWGSLTPQIIYELNQRFPSRKIQAEHGVLVHNVFPDSPADKSGIQIGDIIETVNDTKVYKTADIASYMIKHPDAVLNFCIIRNGVRLKIQNLIPEDQ